MTYLHLFKTKQEHDTARSWGGEYKEPWVAYIDDESKEVTYNKGWAERYLTFEALESGTFTLMFDTSKTVDYSTDGGITWNQLESNTPTPTINAGENIMFKGELEQIPGVPYPTACLVSSTSRFNAMGNAYSLLYGENFESIDDITGKGLGLLFLRCFNLVSAKNLSLPATTLSDDCYKDMFNSCTSLTSAPALPATTLADSCYYGMFAGCTSLTSAPALPATTLTNGCYCQMFLFCNSLTTAPELPATTLAQSCYNSMFDGCTSLTTAPELPATTLAQSCYNSMFDGCTSLTTAPELPATTLAEKCYNDMFRNCTSLTTAPALPATTLDYNYCYKGMFRGCTLLSYIKMLATNVSASYCLSDWVSGVASSGTFVKHPSMTTLPSGNNGIPTGWTVQDASV